MSGDSARADWAHVRTEVHTWQETTHGDCLCVDPWLSAGWRGQRGEASGQRSHSSSRVETWDLEPRVRAAFPGCVKRGALKQCSSQSQGSMKSQGHDDHDGDGNGK